MMRYEKASIHCISLSFPPSEAKPFVHKGPQAAKPKKSVVFIPAEYKKEKASAAATDFIASIATDFIFSF